MKNILTTAACASLLLLSACNDSKQAEQTPVAEKETAPQAEVKTQKTALTSGIELAYIDESVRPQDNFYQYVNGGWLKSVEIPADKTAVGSFYDLRDQSDDDVKAIIEELSNATNLTAGTDEQKVADLYNSYMNQEQRDALGLAPIQHILDEVKGMKSKDDLMTFFGKYQAQGITSPLYLYISMDAKDSSRYTTHVWQGGLALPDRDYYLKDDERYIKLRDGYKAHIEKVFTMLGLENGKAAGETILALETKLAGYHRDNVKNRDSEARYNKYEMIRLNELTSDINWTNWLTEQHVANHSDMIVNQPDFIQGFGTVLQETSMDDWKTYLTFHTISSFASYLTAELDAENFEFFSKQLNGLQQQKPQWKRGVALVNSKLGEVIGKVYVSRHFKPEAKARMTELVENLRSAYGHSIDDLTWMSEDTKKQAHVKLAAFTPKIGYPDKWEDYSALDVKGEDLVGNVVRAGIVGYQKEVEKLGGPIRKWEWGMTPQTVNAYYHPLVNEIVFPAAILQPPFFNMEADDAVNYGGIGAVIGHEMGHGFDDQGSRYDAEGNLRNWWTDADLDEFKRRTKNLIEQYDGYEVYEGLNVNGSLTVGENIGDLSGLTIAYKAYKASLNGKEAPVIDGLTGDQRFFLGFAQIWRSKKVEEAMRNAVATDPHSPGEFRALGSLSNMDEFYKAYDVKEGDAMYIAPENRVKIW